MLTLFGADTTNSQKVAIALHELGLEFETLMVAQGSERSLFTFASASIPKAAYFLRMARNGTRCCKGRSFRPQMSDQILGD